MTALYFGLEQLHGCSVIIYMGGLENFHYHHIVIHLLLMFS